MKVSHLRFLGDFFLKEEEAIRLTVMTGLRRAVLLSWKAE